MSIFNKYKKKKFKEYVDIIEWINDTSENLIWRFPCYRTKVKYGAELTVSKAQIAVLISDGQFADVYQPGSYKLTIENMPILSTIKKWRDGYKAPFKADILYVNTKDYWNMRWATNEPIMMEHPQFGSIKIQVCGVYSFKVDSDPIQFIRSVSKTDEKLTAQNASNQLHEFVIEKFTNYLSISKINIVELSTNQNEFSREFTFALKNDFSNYGLELTKFAIRNIILPEWLFIH